MMKIALITGASSGLGREFVRQIPKLYQNLDEIWVVARRAERLNELEMKLKVPVRIFDGDLNQDYIYKKLGIALGKSHANVRMLVNAAGYGKIGTFCEYGWKEETGMVDLNCRSLTRMTALCLRARCSRSSRPTLPRSWRCRPRRRSGFPDCASPRS